MLEKVRTFEYNIKVTLSFQFHFNLPRGNLKKKLCRKKKKVAALKILKAANNLMSVVGSGRHCSLGEEGNTSEKSHITSVSRTCQDASASWDFDGESLS